MACQGREGGMGGGGEGCLMGTDIQFHKIKKFSGSVTAM